MVGAEDIISNRKHLLSAYVNSLDVTLLVIDKEDFI